MSMIKSLHASMMVMLIMMMMMMMMMLMMMMMMWMATMLMMCAMVVAMIMMVRLRVFLERKDLYPNAKNVKPRYNLAKRYHEFLGKRTKVKNDKDRKKMVFKIE